MSDAYPAINPPLAELIAVALRDVGYVILDQAFPIELLAQLAVRANALKPEQFKAAGIGRDAASQHNAAIRKDQIRWIADTDLIDAQYLNWMDQLRLELNSRLFLGLFDFESHYAHYAPGAYYKKHLDAFRGNNNRIVSTILYLNKNWQASAGGELRLYTQSGDKFLLDVIPEYGRFVIFLSDVFPHEVKVTQQDRYSIAGWYRINNSSSSRVDPT